MAGQGTVTIRILGDAKNAIGAFDDLGRKVGSTDGGLKKLGAAFVGFGAIAATGIAAAGTALYEIGASFDEAYDKIRVQTGATGKSLDALKDDFRQVVQDVPTDFGKASDAIAQVSAVLGDSGPRVEQLSEQFLELSRITGTDLATNTKAGLDAIMNWNVEGDDMGRMMDELFRASQLTGTSFNELASAMTSTGLQLRALGFSTEESIALVSELTRSGFEAADVMPALGKAMAVAAKDGKDAGTLFRETFEAIQSAPDATSAAGIALDVFGAKAGPKFAELIREGKLGYQDLMGQIADGKDTILGAGKDTQDFSEKWELFKNRVLVALEPIATKVFDALGKAMDKLPGIMKNLEPRFQAVRDFIVSLQPAFDKVVTAIGVFVSIMRTILAPILKFITDHWDQLKIALIAVGVVVAAAAAVITGVMVVGLGVLVVAIAGAVAAVAGLVTGLQFLWEKTQGIRDFLGGVFSDALAAVTDAFKTVRDVVQEVWDKTEPLRALLAGGLFLALGMVYAAVKLLGTVFLWLKDQVLGPVLDKIKEVVDWAGKAAQAVSQIPGVSQVGGAVAGGAANAPIFQNPPPGLGPPPNPNPPIDPRHPGGQSRVGQAGMTQNFIIHATEPVQAAYEIAQQQRANQFMGN